MRNPLIELERQAVKLEKLEAEKERVRQRIAELIREAREQGIEWKVIGPAAHRNVSYLAHRFSE